MLESVGGKFVTWLAKAGVVYFQKKAEEKQRYKDWLDQKSLWSAQQTAEAKLIESGLASMTDTGLQLAPRQILAQQANVQGTEDSGALGNFPAFVLNRNLTEAAKEEINLQRTFYLAHQKIEENEAKTNPQTQSIKEINEPDEDWFTKWRRYARDVSDPVMQWHWAGVLAGEFEKPGRFSLHSLRMLEHLSKDEAELFSKLAPYTTKGDLEKTVYIPQPIFRLSKKDSITYSHLLSLESVGLFISLSNNTIITSYNYHKYLQEKFPRVSELKNIQFITYKETPIQGKYWWVYSSMSTVDRVTYYKVYSLSKAGGELITLCEDCKSLDPEDLEPARQEILQRNPGMVVKLGSAEFNPDELFGDEPELKKES